MIKQTVTYEDFNGNTATEDLYFNLSKSEIIDMEMAEGGAMSDRLKRIEQAEDARAAYREIKEVVLSAYGKRSEDGRKFLKSSDIREDFEQSAAYDQFIWDLFKDVDKMTNFINGIIPQKALKEAMAEQENRKVQLGSEDDEKTKVFQSALQEAQQPEEPARGTFGQPVEQQKKELSEDEMREKLKDAGLL